MSIESLPLEQLITIFKYLAPTDRRICRLVSSKFSSAAQFFRQDYALHLHHCFLSTVCAPVTTILASQLTFPKLILNEVALTFGIDAFWSKLGETVRELTLESRFYSAIDDLPAKILNVLRHMKSLRTLHLESGFELFGEDFGKNFCDSEFVQVFSGIERLILTKVPFEKENEYDAFIGALKNLKSIEIIPMYFERHPTHAKNSFSFVQKHARLIKCALGDLGTLVAEQDPIEGLELRSLSYSLDMKQHETFDSFFDSNPSIEFLEMHTGMFLHRNYASLKVLRVRMVCPEMARFKLLDKHVALEELHILYPQTNAQTHTCFFGHEILKNENLKHLFINGLRNRICPLCTEKMANSFPNLERLILKYCQFDDSHMRLILRKFTNLKELVVESNHLTDEGILGDPACSIGGLRRLQELNVSEAHRITDVSLRKWPFMPELKKIWFGYIPDITDAGMQNFTTNCPSLEFIRLAEGTNLTDSTIEILTTKLGRLKSLSLLSCGDLTDHSWHLITQNLKYLHTLEVADLQLELGKKYKILRDMPWLKILSDDGFILSRADFYTMDSYVKRSKIPYSELDPVMQAVVGAYTNEEMMEFE